VVTAIIKPSINQVFIGLSIRALEVKEGVTTHDTKDMKQNKEGDFSANPARSIFQIPNFINTSISTEQDERIEKQVHSKK